MEKLINAASQDSLFKAWSSLDNVMDEIRGERTFVECMDDELYCRLQMTTMSLFEVWRANEKKLRGL